MEEIKTPTGDKITPNVIEEAKDTYFFERHDGSIIHVQEREAWDILKGGNRVVGPYINPPKMIGVSDGRLFQKAVQEAHALHREGKTEEAKERLRQGEREELEAARGKFKRPRNYDMVDKNGQPFNPNSANSILPI